ncbi:hypothetical protein RFI_16613, partial [Reticulomyxa filosa]
MSAPTLNDGKTVKTALSELQLRLQKMTEYSKFLSQYETDIKKKIQQHEKDIDKHVDSLIHKLNERRKVIKNQMFQWHYNKQTVIESEIKNCKTAQSQKLKSEMEILDLLSQENIPSIFSVYANQFDFIKHFQEIATKLSLIFHRDVELLQWPKNGNNNNNNGNDNPNPSPKVIDSTTPNANTRRSD